MNNILLKFVLLQKSCNERCSFFSKRSEEQKMQKVFASEDLSLNRNTVSENKQKNLLDNTDDAMF